MHKQVIKKKQNSANVEAFRPGCSFYCYALRANNTPHFLLVHIHQFSSRFSQKSLSFDKGECKYKGTQSVCYALFVFAIFKLYFSVILIHTHNNTFDVINNQLLATFSLHKEV